MPESVSTKRAEKAESSYVGAVDRFAEHPRGHYELTTRVADLNAGAAPGGDRVGVIEDALVTHAHVLRVPRPRQRLEGDGLVSSSPSTPAFPTPVPPVEFAADLAEAMRTNKVMPEGDRGGRTSKPTNVGDTALTTSMRTGERSAVADIPRAQSRVAGQESSLARALRTGEPIPGANAEPVDTAGLPDEPVTIGGVTITRGQTPFIQRWGNDPVNVTPRKNIRHFKGNGWSEYDYTTGGTRPVNSPNGDTPSESLFGHSGVLVIENVRTGEQGAVRARWDAHNGVWHIHEDITT